MKICNFQIRRTHCQRCFCKDVKRRAYLRSAEDGHGDQAWHSLWRARTARNATNLSNQLLERTFTSPDPLINLRQRNKNARSFSRDDKGQAGFIAPVGKDPVNGGKRSGVPYNFGKSSGTKGKGNMHKRLGFQPERGEQRKFGGFCTWCWRSRHKEAHCWFLTRVHEEQSTAGHVAKRHARMDQLLRERARSQPAQK